MSAEAHHNTHTLLVSHTDDISPTSSQSEPGPTVFIGILNIHYNDGCNSLLDLAVVSIMASDHLK